MSHNNNNNNNNRGRHHCVNGHGQQGGDNRGNNQPYYGRDDDQRNGEDRRYRRDDRNNSTMSMRDWDRHDQRERERGRGGNREQPRHDDQRPHERARDGNREETIINPKRPAASPSAASASAVNDSTSVAPPKRAKKSGQTETASPTDQSNTATNGAASVETSTGSSNNDSDEFVIPEDEETYKKLYVDCLREMDKPLDNVSNQAHCVPMGWDETKQAAVETTLQKLSNIARPDNYEPDNYDSESSDDSVPGCASSSNKPQSGLSQGEIKFIRALQFCPPIDAGFHVVRAVASKICYCPCSSNVDPWRNTHKIYCNRICEKNPLFEPNHLMDHLKMEGGVYKEKEQGRPVDRPLRDIYHYATKVYLECLYGDWHGKGFAHKGLNPVSSAENKKAQDEETRLLEREIIVGRREIRKQEEEKEKLRANLDKQNKQAAWFKKLARDHQEKIKSLETMREKLQVQKRDDVKLSDSQIAMFEKMATHNFDMMRNILLKKPADLEKEVEISVLSESGGSGFSLQHFFDNLYDDEHNRKDPRTVLFGNENANNRIAKLIVSKWIIDYGKQEVYDFKSKADARAQKKKDTAIDEGGPYRQFVTDIFKQLDTLSVRVGSRNVKLFENTSSGVNVKTDDIVNQSISIAAKKYVKNTEKEEKQIVNECTKRAKDYVRAIGRIILHSFAHKQTLPSNAMPLFIVNVLLRGYDDRYHRDDILKHINKLDVNGNSLLKWLVEDDNDERDENGNAWTPDTFFSKWIPNNFIHTRKVLLGSLLDGLTLGGTLDPSNGLEKGCGLLCGLPFEAIQRIYFSKPGISLEDLWKVIKPKYGEGEPHPSLGMTERDKERIVKEQKAFFDDNFKKYLEESAKEDKSFLVKFVECATGSNYLPYDEKFKIYIDFNFSAAPDDLPKFHACTFEVVIPGFECFFCDYKTFKDKKMNFAIGEVYNQFEMN